MKLMKGSVLLAVVLAVWSSGVLAEAIKLSDPELDAITAGNAQVVIANSGNSDAFNLKENKHGVHGVCINCEGTPPSNGPAVGVLTVENRGRGVFMHMIGKPHFPQLTF